MKKINRLFKFIYRYNYKLARFPIWKSITILFVATLCAVPLMVVIEVIAELLDITSFNEEIHDEHELNFATGDIIVTCVIVSILETFLYQFIPIVLIRKYITKNFYFTIIFPAIIFGAMHYYSIGYIVYAFFTGVVYNYGFYAYYRYHSLKLAYWAIVVVHGLRNLLAISAMQFDF